MAAGPGAAASEGAGDGAAALERVAAKAGRAETKVQQKFRKLLAKVDGLKQRLRTWQARRGDINAEIARFQATRAQVGAPTRELVMVLDRAYGHRSLGKKDREVLAEVIAELLLELLEDGGHDDLKPLYNRYTHGDFDAEAAAADAGMARELRAMFEGMGIDFGDADVDTVEKLHAYATARLEAEQVDAAARAAAPPPRRRSARQVAAEQAREEERAHAQRALQDVYRQLARAHHPDREQDPAVRARKTELMRDVNAAYEAKDLLRLLELQLTLEDVASEDVATIADERLARYNRILDEQARQLAEELAELEAPFRIELDLSSRAKLTPEQVLAEIANDILVVEERIASLVADRAAFADLGRLRTWLRAERRERDVERMDEPPDGWW